MRRAKTVVRGSEFEIPETFHFEDLDFYRDPVTRDIHCNVEPLEAVLRANGIHAHLFRNRPYYKWLCMTTMLECYEVHLARGGKPDATLDELLSQSRAR